jgi:hypothetical protein
MNALNRACFVISSVIAMSCASASATARETEIRFKKGATATSLSGVWSGETKTYVFRTRGAQHIVLHLNEGKEASNPLAFTLYSYCAREATGVPEVSDAVRYEATLPCAGRYSLDLATPSGMTKPQGAVKYSLRVSIK